MGHSVYTLHVLTLKIETDAHYVYRFELSFLIL